MQPTFLEFFAGGGMARAGLGPSWRCVFANDFDFKKGRIYQRNWGQDALKISDIRSLQSSDIPGSADLAWASFPCQDLSLAGGGAGLKGDRSGTFWPFWALMKVLIAEDRSPQIVVLENVCGTLVSHGGKDFAAICATFEEAGYRYGAIVVDAALFVPQSRPRLFVIGVRDDAEIPAALVTSGPSSYWHTRALRAAVENVTPKALRYWVWWALPKPAKRPLNFVSLIEENPTGVSWHSEEETSELLDKMSEINLAKVEQAKRSDQRMVGAIYKRTRLDQYARKVQRAEVRFDDIAGCLRTPAGGSSRQLILVIDGGKVRSRLISGRETARLMGLPDEYSIPDNYNETYHLTGDGVVVPVVRHLAEHLLQPLVIASRRSDQVAA